jgi:hypothetical protein
MAEIGYALSSEEHPPLDLVTFAKKAEDAGFAFALISDHYHPWVDRQGHSPFVWSVIGAIATATRTLRLGTGVTCPLIRIHPAVIAQAAATAAAGGLTGALVGLGIPEYEAKQYESKVKGGNLLISVHTDDRAQRSRAKEICERNKAEDIATAGEARAN